MAISRKRRKPNKVSRTPQWLTTDRLREIEAEDLRRAAIHEVGHAVVAEWAGYSAQPWVYKNPYYFHTGKFHNPDDSPISERQYGLAKMLWGGSCRALWISMPEDVGRWATLGGWLAEQIEIHGLDWVKCWIKNPFPLARHLHGHIADGHLSDSDLQLMGRWTQKDLVKVLRILRRNWPALLEWVAEVMADPRIDREGSRA